MHIAEGAPVPDIPHASGHFIDEMQRIARRKRSKILRRPASFVIGSHWNHRREFRKAGMAHETVIVSGLTVGNLQTIVDKRIEWARRNDDEPVPRVNREAAAALIARYGDDLWATECHLYEVFQNLTQVSAVNV